MIPMPLLLALIALLWSPQSVGSQAERTRVDALIESFKSVRPANPTLAAELRTMREDDQRYRSEGLRLWNEKGVDSPEAKVVWDKQSVLDAKNQSSLEAIVATHGWPGVRIAGLAGADAAFLIVDHAPLAFQKRYLPRLQAAVDARDAVPMWAAMLDDRVRTNEGRPQRFGTQVHKEAGWTEWRLYPIEDEAHVDDRRAAAGFEPLAEYLMQFGIAYRQQRPELSMIEEYRDVVDPALLLQAEKKGLYKRDEYPVLRTKNPFYLRGDFNGDGRTDVAVWVTQRSTGKPGVAMIHSPLDTVRYLGAGAEHGDFRLGPTLAGTIDADAWHVLAPGTIVHAFGTVKEIGAVEGRPFTLQRETLELSFFGKSSYILYWANGRYWQLWTRD